jgi:hypothetical protein
MRSANGGIEGMDRNSSVIDSDDTPVSRWYGLAVKIVYEDKVADVWQIPRR